jgi:hypothetical protein
MFRAGLFDASNSIDLPATSPSGNNGRLMLVGMQANAEPSAAPLTPVEPMLSIDDNRAGCTGAWLKRLVALCLVCFLVEACGKSPTQPHDMNFPTGRWIGDGACLSVTADVCDLVVGCGHGQFSPPVVRADGTFEIAGTYRIEAGPVSINPAPPATFSGVLRGQTLTLSVTPSDPSLRPASYVLLFTSASGKCTVPCV